MLSVRKAVVYGLAAVCVCALTGSSEPEAAAPERPRATSSHRRPVNRPATPAPAGQGALCPPSVPEVSTSSPAPCIHRIEPADQSGRAIRAGAASVPADVLLGVDWETSELVSFDPNAGEVVAEYMQLYPPGAYTGLAYDRNHHLLYAMSQDSHALTVIDTDSLRTVDVLALRVDPRVQGLIDTVALAYDPVLDRLFTVVGVWTDYPAGPIASQLATIDRVTGELLPVGRSIDGPWIESLAFSETDWKLYAIGVYGAGSWDSSYLTNVLRIDPDTGQAETLFEAPYHTMLGFAVREPFTFFSWINSPSHLYALTDLATQTVTPLGSSDSVGVIDAMIEKTFSLPDAPIPIPPAPVSFVLDGKVTGVSDPKGRLHGRIRAGQRFSGTLTYDAAALFQVPDPNNSPPNGFTLRLNGIRYVSSGMSVSIANDRYDWNDQSLTDELQISAPMSPPALASWTLTDRTGGAVSLGNVLPEEIDLSDWAGNRFDVTGYDVCCTTPTYTWSGSVDHVTRTESSITQASRRRPSHIHP